MSKKNILIIDDSETSILLFKSLFDESCEIVVHSENDSRAALKNIMELKPDLIILDLMMPGIDGFQILTKLKENKNIMNIPIIILSAIHDNKTINRVKQLGAIDFIKKPFIVEEVIGTILYYLNQLNNVQNE